MLGGLNAVLGGFARLRRGLGGLLGLLGAFLDRAGDLLGRPPRRLDHLHLTLGALGDIADRLRDLTRCPAGLLRGRGHLV